MKLTGLRMLFAGTLALAACAQIPHEEEKNACARVAGFDDGARPRDLVLTPPRPAEAFGPGTPTNPHDDITVLALVTGKADAGFKDRHGSTGKAMDLIEKAMNKSLKDSGSFATIKIKTVKKIAYDEGNTCAGTMLLEMRVGWYTFAQVATWRKNEHADLVVLFAELSDYSGVSWEGVNAEDAFAVVDWRSAPEQKKRGNHAFAHELGHLAGCSHNPEDPDLKKPTYKYGHGFCHKAAQWQTIMAVPTNKCPEKRILNRFSNPDKFEGPIRTGKKDEHDCARVWDERADAMTKFMK